MKRRAAWLMVFATMLASVAATLTATWLTMQWAVPEWVKQNSGPWVAFGALVTLLGVVIGLSVQSRLANADREARTEDASEARTLTSAEAKKDRENLLAAAREERDAQETRAKREWFREKQFEAYVAVLDATHRLNRDIQHPEHNPADAMDILDRAITAAKAVTFERSIRDVLQDTMEEIWNAASAQLLGETTRALGRLQFIAYGEVHKFGQSLTMDSELPKSPS